jgi:2-desacetyl-2-hydroxyethyl bacteriochlorophyllide A dehydrogenase
MRAVTFQGPRSVEVLGRAEPELQCHDDALIRVVASGICGSDLHIYHGRVPTARGFTLGHEYVGEVLAVGDAVRSVSVGERVLGTFATACGTCAGCRLGLYHHCHEARVFGLGPSGGSLPGTQAELALVPHADLTLRRAPDGLPDELALLAGDAMGTGYHAIAAAGIEPGETCAVVGLGPVGLCAATAAKAAGTAAVMAIDMVESRLEVARALGADVIHAGEEDALARVMDLTHGRGAHVTVEAVGSAGALETACRITRRGGTVSLVGVHVAPCRVDTGLIFRKGLRIVSGLANVVAHLDRVLAMMTAGVLDPGPIVTHELALADAPDAYEAFDRRETLKILLRP